MNKLLTALCAVTLVAAPVPAFAQDHRQHDRHERWDRHDRAGDWQRRGYDRRDHRGWGQRDQRWRYRTRDCDDYGYGYGGRSYDCRSYGDGDAPYVILRLFNDIFCYSRRDHHRAVCPRDWYDY